MEIWKDIPGYEGLYKASNMGHIKSLRYNKIMKGTPTYDGYLRIILQKNNIKKHVSIHSIVASLFLEDTIYNPNGTLITGRKCINHKDENKENNSAETLEYCDDKYNANYGTRNERMAKSLSKALKGKPRPEQCKKIICVETKKIYNSISDANKEFNTNNIGRACRGDLKSCKGYHWIFLEEGLF